ncbi:dim gamma-tubulin 6 [Arctopsyche grandis]|uniref:dim gamma-tubulin 6 n=1 Tax=Arctopsyche grandis TaxID=121162 RepID=UPI00406D6C94
MSASRQTSTMNENLKMAEQINAALYQNLYLLGLKFPMSEDLKRHMKEDMLKVPNSAAFFQVAYYLMSVIDKKYITADLIYVFHDPKMSTQFRKQFLSFVNDIEKKYEGYISPIMSSWLVTAGGYKIIKLFFQLSQVALYAHIIKSKSLRGKIPDMKSTNLTMINESLPILQKELQNTICKGYIRSQNMEKMANIYNEEIRKIKIDIDVKTNTLQEFVKKLLQKADKADHSYLEELSVVMSPHSLLSDWENYIKQKIENVETTWNRISENAVKTIQCTKSTSEEAIQLYTQKSKKNNTLEYDPIRDKTFTENTKELNEFMGPVFNNIIDNGVLNLPNLFKAYNIILNQYVKIIQSFNLNDKYNIELKEKAEKFKAIKMQIRELNITVKYIQDQLSENKIHNIQSKDSDDEWIINSTSIPSISDLLK